MSFRYKEAMVEPPEIKELALEEEAREQAHLEDLAYDEYVDSLLEEKYSE